MNYLNFYFTPIQDRNGKERIVKYLVFELLSRFRKYLAIATA